VYTRSLKTNIAVQLVVLFLLAMILTAFVMLILMQKALIRSEISKGYALLSGIKLNNTNYSNSKNVIEPSDFQDDFIKMITETGFSCILLWMRIKIEFIQVAKAVIYKANSKQLPDRQFGPELKPPDFLVQLGGGCGSKGRT